MPFLPSKFDVLALRRQKSMTLTSQSCSNLTLHRRKQWHFTPVLLPGKSLGREEPGGLQSMGSQRVGHDWTTSLSLFTFMHWRRKPQPTSVFLPGKSQGWRKLLGCSPWGRSELDTTERLHFHFSLSCTGEGHGNPLQCSCLEKPKDGGAWWAAIYGVAQSQTQLKKLSSSSSIM